jgi:hypothetical protein
MPEGCVATVELVTEPGRAHSPTGQRWATGSNVVMHLQLGSGSGTLLDGSASWNSAAEGALSI